MTHDSDAANDKPAYLAGIRPAAASYGKFAGADSAAGPGDDAPPSRWDELVELAMTAEPYRAADAALELREAISARVRVLGLAEAYRRLGRP